MRARRTRESKELGRMTPEARESKRAEMRDNDAGSPTRTVLQGCVPRIGCVVGVALRANGRVRTRMADLDDAVGDHVVINPMAAPGGIIGNGGPTGALADYLLIEQAVRGRSLEVVPDHIPFEVAALNEPMAVARHGVNQVAPKPSDKVVIFGAGPIGLGATIGFKSAGAQHVTVVDLIQSRLDKALKVGADAVINFADEDVAQRLIDIHGPGESIFPGKAGTDIYFDAAGAPAVINTALGAAKTGAKVVVVAVHKEPVPVDFLNVMSNEVTIVGSMGYPKEIFEVTKDLIANWEKYAVIVSHTLPFDDVAAALQMAATPGAADKVVVTFG